jgi:endoglycosylceramidase
MVVVQTASPPGGVPRPVSATSGTACPPDPEAAVDACGRLTAPGDPGGFIQDGFGRDVIMHGVNAVYKTYPFDFTAVAGQPNSLTPTDASDMASLGFDIVRLGIVWEGLEPGATEDYAEPATAADDNYPAVCSEGLVTGDGTAGPGGSDSQLATAAEHQSLTGYIADVKATVDMLARYGIYSLVDMHQDVYNAHFAGEGAPDWAVCTNGLPATNTGNWSANYFTPAVGVAFDHFWDNDVVGGLQQNYDYVWSQVASALATDPGVIGYDVFNEPFSSEIATVAGNAAFDAKLECFYTGTLTPGQQSETHLPLLCPPTDPALGAIPSIEHADPNHLVFYEPDVGNDFGDANYIGPMPYPRLVLGFHDYCLASAGQAYFDFYNSPACSVPEQTVMHQERAARASAATGYQPGGPAWFMSEFGAGENVTDLTRVTQLANANLLGWTYWQWKQYGDPTGGSTEALVRTDASGQDVIDPTKAAVIVQPFAQAVAGTPVSMSYDPSTRHYSLTFTPDRAISAPTVVFVPVNAFYDLYPQGACPVAIGATPVLKGDKVLVTHPTAPTVTLTITPCPAG